MWSPEASSRAMQCMIAFQWLSRLICHVCMAAHRRVEWPTGGAAQCIQGTACTSDDIPASLGTLRHAQPSRACPMGHPALTCIAHNCWRHGLVLPIANSIRRQNQRAPGQALPIARLYMHKCRSCMQTAMAFALLVGILAYCTITLECHIHQICLVCGGGQCRGSLDPFVH